MAKHTSHNQVFSRRSWTLSLSCPFSSCENAVVWKAAFLRWVLFMGFVCTYKTDTHTQTVPNSVCLISPRFHPLQPEHMLFFYYSLSLPSPSQPQRGPDWPVLIRGWSKRPVRRAARRSLLSCLQGPPRSPTPPRLYHCVEVHGRWLGNNPFFHRNVGPA